MTRETRFTVSCSHCGEVDLATDQLWLVVPTSGGAHFDFHCPGCGQYVRRALDDTEVDLLAPLVAVEELDVPPEALEPHDGPPLTVDDLIDLMLALE